MKLALQIAALGWLLVTVNSQLSIARGQGTAFIYQGRLQDGGNPANGSYDLRFTLFDSGTNGSPQGPVFTNAATAVSNGLFTVTLDFGNQFPGADRWLDISVCTNGAGNFITLTPRQPLTPTPYAITAGNVVPGGIPPGLYTNAMIFNNANNQFSGNGAGLTKLPFSSLSAQAQTQFTNVANGAAAAATVGMVTNTFTFTPQGNNDSTAYLQTNLAKGGSFIFSPGIYYASNLVLTNFTTIYGYNATIVMQPGATNFLVYMPSNIINVQIFGLKLDGGQSGIGWEYGPTLSGRINGQLNRGNVFSNRSGIQFNTSGGGVLRDCLVTGFPGYGYFLINTNSSGDYLYPRAQLRDCHADRNFIGIWPSAWNYDFDPTGSAPDMNAEYYSFASFAATRNTIGIGIDAGNNNVVGALVTGNYIGVYFGAGHNAAHGIVSSCTINHNNYAFWGQGSSEMICNNLLYANPIAGYFDACGDLQFCGNRFYPGESVVLTNTYAFSTVSNSLPMFFYGNSYSGNWATNPFYFQQQALASTNTVVSFWGNYSYTINGDNDGQPVGGKNAAVQFLSPANQFNGTFNGNGSGLTGLNATQLAGTLPIANLPGITTNVSNAGITFYITNGLIMRVTVP